MNGNNDRYLINHQHALNYILAGKSLFTCLNTNTDNRLTFFVRKFETSWHFVYVLYGSGYRYIGGITCETDFRLTEKSSVKEDSVSFKSFKYIFEKLRLKELSHKIEIYHHAKCGRCGRTLTTPESIINGFGDDCLQMLKGTKFVHPELYK